MSTQSLNSNYYKKILQERAKEVLATIPNPFGTFEKATYEMPVDYYRGIRRMPTTYRFTTTCRSEENCIDIMKKHFSNVRELKTCRVYKIQNGERELVFYNDTFKSV